MDIADGMMFDDEMMTKENWITHSSDREIPRNGSGDLLEEVFDSLEADGYGNKSFDLDLDAEEMAAYAKLPPRQRIPQQDMDKAGGPGNDKSIVEDLAEVKMKLHDLTLQQFNDQSYTIKDPEAVYFGQSQSRKRKTDEDVTRQLDKLLGLGQYSNGNMIVSKISPYVEPIIGSANSFICLFRALFNIFTWRDPFLSFWVTIVGTIAAVVLFFFPWRIVLFVAGLVLVGPQVSLSLRGTCRRECRLFQVWLTRFRFIELDLPCGERAKGCCREPGAVRIIFNRCDSRFAFGQ